MRVMRAIRAVALLAFATASPVAPLPAAAQVPGAWDFIVRLDGRAIGTHRFALAGDGDSAWLLASDANFDIKLLGITVYSYRHRARERWSGGCLESIEAVTDDDGRRTEVRGAQVAGAFRLQSDEAAAGCVMSFAYWHPRLREQKRLLDPGTGRIVPVRIEPLAAPSAARTTWRITGLANPIDVLWEGGRWTGLDTTVDGRRLTYRLQ